MAGVELTAFVRAGRHKHHQELVAKLFAKLYSSGFIEPKEMPCLIDPSTDAYVYEPYVCGKCPNCGNSTGGNACEDCCLPHDPVRLIDPVCSFTGKKPSVKEIKRLVFPLEKLRAPIAQFVRQTPMSARLRTVAERMLAGTLPDIPLSHPTEW